MNPVSKCGAAGSRQALARAKEDGAEVAEARPMELFGVRNQNSETRSVTVLSILVTVGVTISCATVPSRPVLIEAEPNGPLQELTLADADPDESVVDVTLGAPRAVIKARAGDAIIVRFPGTHAGTWTLDGDQGAIVDVTADGYVWLLGAGEPGLRLIRRVDDRPGEFAAAVVVRERAASAGASRVLVLDDRADGSERINGLGNVMLVNGQTRPTVSVGAGGVERWHLVNAASARTFTLLLPGHVFSVVDGSETGELALRPGERAVVDVRFAGPPGESVDLATLDGEPSNGSPAEAYPILRVTFILSKEVS